MKDINDPTPFRKVLPFIGLLALMSIIMALTVQFREHQTKALILEVGKIGLLILGFIISRKHGSAIALRLCLLMLMVSVAADMQWALK